MSQFSPAIAELIKALRVLPGVGQKSAQRMAFQLLEREASGCRKVNSNPYACTCCGGSLRDVSYAHRKVSSATFARTHNVKPPKHFVLLSHQQMLSLLNKQKSFEGLYFVLMGHLSPLDG